MTVVYVHQSKDRSAANCCVNIVPEEKSLQLDTESSSYPMNLNRDIRAQSKCLKMVNHSLEIVSLLCWCLDIVQPYVHC